MPTLEITVFFKIFIELLSIFLISESRGKSMKEQVKYINELIKKLELDHVSTKPCTNTQLDLLHSISNGRKLPGAYMEFMSIMGNGTDFMRGDSCFMDEIEDLKQGANELLEENESEQRLGEEDFVFWMSQGCMFCFFKLVDDDNPAVYFYNEVGEDRFIKVANSLTEFLIHRYEMNEKLFKEK